MRKIIFIFFTSLSLIIVGVFLTYIIIFPSKNNESQIILGIIDGNLALSHNNILNTVNLTTEEEK